MLAVAKTLARGLGLGCWARHARWGLGQPLARGWPALGVRAVVPKVAAVRRRQVRAGRTVRDERGLHSLLRSGKPAR